MKKTRTLVFVGLLIAMEIIFTRFLSFQTATVRIGFGFIPIALSSMLFGPVIGGTTAMLSDILGMMVFARGGPYFPGFTFSALLRGVILGLFLYRKEKSVLRVALAVLTTTVVVDLGLNTIWITMLTGKAAAVLMVERLIKSAVMYPIQVIIIPSVWNYVGRFVQSSFLNRKTTI